MDAGHIMVAVLTTAALALAVWAEIHSRRNAPERSASELEKMAKPDAQEGEHLHSKRTS